MSVASGAGLTAARAPIRRARHSPGFIYTSEEIYAREKETIFMRDWLCVGRVDEIENPGDYMTFRVMDEPIIIARAADGAINAFRNSCAHRGLVVAKESGNTKGFTCDYHGWSYDLTGKLVGAPFMEDVQDFDLSNCRLPPLMSDVWAGWVFVTFAADAPALADHLSEFADEFAVLGMGSCRTGNKQSWEVACNWKIMNENNHDLYHVQATHADTFGDAITHGGLKFNLTDGGRVSAFYSDAPLLPDRKSLFGPMPWMQDQPYEFACVGHLPPNLVLVGRSDSNVAVISWPVSVNQTQLLAYQLFPDDVFDQPDMAEKLKAYDDFVTLILDEDTGIVAETQKAVSRDSYQPGPMSRLEANVHHCLQHYFSQVFGDAS